MSYRRETIGLLAAVAVVFVALGIDPVADRLTWAMENAPAVIGIAVLAAVHRRFPLTRLGNRLVAVHAVILMVGGHWTYAEVPLGFWVQDWLDLSRNHYDRLGHFAQGFVPALLVREVLLRTSPLRPGRWLFFLVASVCLAMSAIYEMVEWWTAVALGSSADDFLGTQGDPWDAQWDMFLCTLGAVASQALLVRVHDRHLRDL